MKNSFLTSLSILAAVLVCGCALRPESGPRPYWVRLLSADAEVGTDGDVLVFQDVEFAFRDRFRVATYDVPVAEGSAVSDLRLFERGMPYRERSEYSWGSFSADHLPDRIRLKWHFRAHEEKRIFRIRYTLHGAVSRYADVADMRLAIVADSWPETVGNGNLRVSLPDGAEKAEIRAWSHGAIGAKVGLPDGGTIKLSAKPLHSGSAWDARIVFPSDLLSELEPTADEIVLPAILEQEAALEADARAALDERRAQMRARAAGARETQVASAAALDRARRLLPVSVGGGLLGLALWAVLYTRGGRASTADGGDPRQVPATVAAALANRGRRGATLVASLWELCDRGVLAAHAPEPAEPATAYRLELVHRPRDLAPHESVLLDDLLAGGGDREAVSLGRLALQARRGTGAVVRFLDAVDETLIRAGLASRAAAWSAAGNALCGALLTGAGLWLSISTDTLAGLPLAAGGALQFALTGALTRLTPAGRGSLRELRRLVRERNKNEDLDNGLVLALSLPPVARPPEAEPEPLAAALSAAARSIDG
ncbi:MAG: DUF2207 domain-containing protein [bacterium]|nr:DUF2207 domain-containing protein [bacterium]